MSLVSVNKSYYIAIVCYKVIDKEYKLCGFINPKLGRFVCTATPEWGTLDWKEGVSLSALYSFNAQDAHETIYYQHMIIEGNVPEQKYYFLK